MTLAGSSVAPAEFENNEFIASPDHDAPHSVLVA